MVLQWLRGLAFWQTAAIALLWVVATGTAMMTVKFLIQRHAQRRLGGGLVMIERGVWAPGSVLVVAPPLILVVAWLLTRR